MGSVIDYIDCPNCGHEACDDFYYKTGEEYIFCNNCGYRYSFTIVDRNKKLSELSEDNWQIVKLENPYGAYRIKYYNSVGIQCGSLADESDYSELRRYLSDDESVEFASVSRFVDGQITTEILVDNGPETDSAGFTEENRNN